MIRTKPFSDADKLRLWEIEKDPQVSKKMPGKIKSLFELEEWLSENIVYGICDVENNIIGFVQLYPLSKTLIKRLPARNAFSKPASNASRSDAGWADAGGDFKESKNLYEISFALPEKYRYTAGLVSNAVREICNLFPKFQIIAFSHPDNVKSIRVLERSGFTLLGKTKYHANEKIENLVYKNH